MRVTNGMMVNNLLGNLSKSRNRLDEYNRQLSTGKQFDMPSQDPTGTAKSMDLKSTIDNNEQYQRNIDQAETWMGATEGALKNATEILHRTRELAVQGANETLSDTDREAVADEIGELKESLVAVANKKHNGQYLFAGHKTGIEPYSEEDLTYQGDMGRITKEITTGVEMNINQNGKFFEDIFEKLEALEQNLKDNNTEVISKENIAELDEKIDKVIRVRSEVGAKQNRLELTKNRLENDKIKFEKLLSQNEDVDIAKTIMNLKMSENVHRAALSSGARIIQPSLMQFLK